MAKGMSMVLLMMVAFLMKRSLAIKMLVPRCKMPVEMKNTKAIFLKFSIVLSRSFMVSSIYDLCERGHILLFWGCNCRLGACLTRKKFDI